MPSLTRFLVTFVIAALLAGSVAAANTGDTLKSIPSPYSCPQGLTYDGQHLWNVDRKSDMIYQLETVNGNIVDSLPAPGYVPRGLTWDGGGLWCVDADEELIYRINPQTRITDKTIYSPVSNPTGLAWDGQYLWVADARLDELHQISPDDGTTIKTIPAPAGAPCGLCFDGAYLWVSDRITNMIYMVTPDHGSVIVSFDSPGPHAWGMAHDGESLWNIDYETDRVYRIAIHGDSNFIRRDAKRQMLEFTHQVRNFGPDTIKHLDAYMAVPESRDGQQLLGDPTFEPTPKEFLFDQWGQKVAHFVFEDLGPTEFATAVMVAKADLYKTRYFVFPEKVGSLEDIPREIRNAYLVNDTKFSINDPVIQKGVEDALGDETNPYWIARKIFEYLIEKLEYERVGGWNIAPTVLARGNGSCSEYSFVYIAMCRAAGLPARYVGSVVQRGDRASYDNVFHRWVEVYLPAYGWIPVDPSGGDNPRPANQANAFGYLNNRFLITTVGGGGSDYLEWSYNSNEHWTSKGRCKIVLENIGEWTPLEDTASAE